VEVLNLQVFVSLILVTGSIVLFAYSARKRDYEHADRLALFPIASDDAVSIASIDARPSASSNPVPSDASPEESHDSQC
jgi:hypothetical protein